MTLLLSVERVCLIGHLVSMAFGLAGLLLVMPHPEFLANIPGGQTAFAWSMAGGGVVYILLGAIAVALYAYRTLGLYGWLTFMLPAVFISLSSELLGTSIGFPFGDYSYLSGLGYKISGLVPFTIPLSWFYLGLSSYQLARLGLRSVLLPSNTVPNMWKMVAYQVLAIAVGAVLLTSWDFVLDPAMSQTAMPFWYWHTPGAFFGMPYQNFAGWFGTGAVFMTVAAVFWRNQLWTFAPTQLNLPLVVYLGNFAFAMIMSVAAGIWVPVLLGLVLGVAPAVYCWQQFRRSSQQGVLAATVSSIDEQPATATVSASSVGVSIK